MPRGRPRKALLSPDLIVDTALALIDAGEPLNMSRVARELSVHVSSLYNHVGDREGLIELLRVRIADEYPVPPLDGLSWQETVRAVASTIHAAFVAHPGLIPYLATKPVSDPRIVTIYSRLAGSMVGAGLQPTDVSLAIRMIDTLALGTALVSSVEPAPWDVATPGGQAMLEASAHWDDDRAQTAEAFERGLDYLIAGLEAELAKRAGSAAPSARQ